MATVYPTAAGAWSTRTWNNDATGAAYGMAPQAGDTVLANGLAITIDVDITVVALSTRVGTTAVAGGSFTTSGTNRTVNADTYGGTTTCLTLTTASSGVQNGNCYGGNTVGFVAYGTLCNLGCTVNGNSFGGAANQAHGASISGTQNGNSTGGTVTACHGSIIQSGAVQNGNSTGGTAYNCYGSYVHKGGVQNGNSTGGSVNSAIGTVLTDGGVQNGNSTGGTAAGAWGTLAQLGGIQCGTQTGGSNATAYGTSFGTGGTVVTTGITDSTASGLRLVNDNTVIRHNGVLFSQISNGATRYTDGNANYPFIVEAGGGGDYTFDQVKQLRYKSRAGVMI